MMQARPQMPPSPIKFVYARSDPSMRSQLAVLGVVLLLVTVQIGLLVRYHTAAHHSIAPTGWGHELQLLRNQTLGLERRVEQRLSQLLHNTSLGRPGQQQRGGWRTDNDTDGPQSSVAADGEHPAGNGTNGRNSSSSSSSSSNSSSAESQAGGLAAAVSTPINVAVMTGVFWTFDGKTDNCSVDGLPLTCKFHTSPNAATIKTADALYYHIPAFAGKPHEKAFPNQLRLAMSLESSAYYGNLDNPSYMCQFDAEMSYRTCAQVVNWYSLESFADLFHMPVKPFAKKEHALVYINSNCGAQSGRSAIMRSLMALKNASVPVHSYGRCDNNKPWPPGNPGKRKVFNRYKFCVTMENSIRQDYVTEKIWDGLAAGCVPVYLGAPSAPRFIPDPTAVIMYDPYGKGNASTPEELDALLDAIGRDEARYSAMLAWKARPPMEQSSPLFRYLWSVQHLSGECFLCQFLARHRANPKPRYTTCLFNRTWMAGAGQKLEEQPDCKGA